MGFFSLKNKKMKNKKMKNKNGQWPKTGVSGAFWPKTDVPENNSGRECCWPYLIGQHPLVFGQKRPGTPGNSYFAQLPPVFGHYMFRFWPLYVPFLAILCSFPVGYSTARTDQHGPQEQLTAKFRPGGVEIDNIFSFFCTVDVPVYRPPVYRFALFTGVFFSCHPVTPVYRWYAGIPGWFMFSCSRSPSCCCTLPHTLLHTTQHNTLGVAGSSQHLPTHHAMCGRRIMPT